MTPLETARKAYVPIGQFATFILPQTVDYEHMAHEVMAAVGDLLGQDHWAHEKIENRGGILSATTTRWASYERIEAVLGSIAERYGAPVIFWNHAPLRAVGPTDA